MRIRCPEREERADQLGTIGQVARWHRRRNQPCKAGDQLVEQGRRHRRHQSRRAGSGCARGRGVPAQHPLRQGRMRRPAGACIALLGGCRRAAAAVGTPDDEKDRKEFRATADEQGGADGRGARRGRRWQRPDALRRRGGRTAQRRRGEGERSLRCRRGAVVMLVGTEIGGGR